MTTLSTSLVTMDAMSNRLTRISDQMSAATATAGRNMLVQVTQVNNHYQQINNTMIKTSQIIRENTAQQEKFNEKAKQGSKDWKSMFTKLKKAGGTAIDFLRPGAKIVDDFVNAGTRLSLVNDGSQTAPEFRDRVFAAAERSRGSFGGMANTVNRLGTLAPDAFGGNNEMVAFAELMQKSFKLGGGSAQDQQAGMEKLAQAMASGKLQGDELQSVMNNAPMLAQAIADFTGKSKGDLKTMSAEGAITADTIKGALFSAAGDINAKFEALPRTFGDVGTQLTNDSLRAFGPLLDRISQLLNSPSGKAFTDALSQSLYLAAAAAGWVVDAIGWIGDGLASLWTISQPVLAAIGGAFTLWALTQTPMLMAQFASMGAKLSALAVKLWAMVAPVLAQAAAWLLVNWPILLIGAAIGFLIFALYKWEDATAEVIGFIGGIFGVLIASIYNKLVFFANIAMSTAEFFMNVWKDPVYAVKKLFYDLVINALEWIQNLATGTSKLLSKLGIKFDVSGVDNLLSKLEAARSGLTSDKDVVTLKRFEQMDYGDAFGIGQEIGRNLSHSASKGIIGAVDSLGDMFTMPKIPGFPAGDGSIPGAGFNAGIGGGDSVANVANVGTVNEVGKINDTVDISSEDLKMMRELAEMKNIQNFVTLTPAFSFGDTHIKQDGRTVDEIIANISDKMNEAIASGAQGVYG